jgi:YggT family protein
VRGLSSEARLARTDRRKLEADHNGDESTMGAAILFILQQVLSLLILAIIISVIMSWLVAFDVVNLRHPFVRQFAAFLEAVTRPVLRPFQRIIPTLGGFDISPIIAFIVLVAIRDYLLPWVFRPIIGLLGG